jgi:hypothetical protein
MRRGQHLRHPIRTLAGAALLAAAFLGPRQAHAIRAQADSRADIKRFGLDQFSRPRRRNPSAKSRAAFGPFNKANGGRWTIRYDGRTGLPSALVSGASAPRPGTSQEAATAFLAEQSDLLGIDPAALSVERVSSAPAHRHVLYSQTYRGLPVEFAHVKVHLDVRGAVTGVHSNFEPDLTLDIAPTITAAQAAAAVRQDAGVAPSSRGALVIFPDQNSGQVRLAWKFTARAKLALWRYYIDAHTGAVIFRYNDLRFICSNGGNGIGGAITGLVYDVDPNTPPGLVVRPFAHQAVLVGNGSNVSVTDLNGNYCAALAEPQVMFTQLQGPYVNVSNFHGPSAEYDNGIGSAWYTMSTPLSSPHPYPSDSVLISSVNIPATDGYGRAPAKVLPIFSGFSVGATQSASSGGEGGNITDDSEVSILDSNGNPVAGYVGKLGAFNATAVPVATSVHTYKLKLRSSAAAGGGYGYDVLQSSYLVLGAAPGAGDPSYSLTWSTANTAPFSPVDAGAPVGKPMASEISLFYQLNRQHDFFTSGSDGRFTTAYSPGVDGVRADGSVAADIYSHPVNVLALMAPDIGDPFYDPDNDNLNFGDSLDASPNDDMALDATVPHHEYTHYVVQKIWNIQNVNQAGAISEGNADYFSATSLNDPSIGTYFNGDNVPLRELDCKVPGTVCARLCSGSESGCNYASCGSNGYCDTPWLGEIHSDSIYFSQALWDIRRALMQADSTYGQACADGLAFQTLLYFPESFQEYLDAELQALSLGAVHACGQGSLSSLNIAALVSGSFNNHGLPLGAGANELHTGFESALDVSTYTSVTGTIYPSGHTDFYTFAAGAGPISIAMTLPAHGQPADGYYEGYGLSLFDHYHNMVATEPASFVYCDADDCKSSAPTVVLNHDNPAAGQMFLQVAGGFNESGVNSLLPYTLAFDYPRSGVLAGSVVQASYNNDVISFSVAVTTWPQTQDYYFAYAQLRDQAQNPIANTRTDVAGGFLAGQTPKSALGMITGQVALQPSASATCAACKTAPCAFSQCHSSVGTVYLEVFGYNVTGRTVSLGLSNPINLATDNGASLTAYNNIFNPKLGQKATVKYEVPSAGHVTIKLYTLGGALVSTLFDNDVPAGEGSVDWSGNNSAGNRVASGVYLVHMAAPGVDKTQKIVVVK